MSAVNQKGLPYKEKLDINESKLHMFKYIHQTQTGKLDLKTNTKRGEPEVKAEILAPIVKKTGAGPTAKSGTGLPGKSSGSKPNSFGPSGKSISSSANKSPSLPSTSFSKNHSILPSYSTPKSSKPSASFGILWLPSRKHNKKKDAVWNPHNYEGTKDRSPSMYNFMSGDSQAYKKKEEEVDLLVPEKNKTPVAMNIGTAVAVVDASSDTRDLENAADKPGLGYNKDESKEAAGDGNDKTSETSDKDYLENKNATIKFPETKDEKEKDYGDKVDSVYLRPPPCRARSTASMDEDDCGIKCLYYTLQCCDCVLM